MIATILERRREDDMSKPDARSGARYGILDCLKALGFDPRWRSKFVRHQDDKYPVRELLRHSWFDLYQRYQPRPVFHHLERTD